MDSVIQLSDIHKSPISANIFIFSMQNLLIDVILLL